MQERLINFQETLSDGKIASQACVHYDWWHETQLVRPLSFPNWLYNQTVKRAGLYLYLWVSAMLDIVGCESHDNPLNASLSNGKIWWKKADAIYCTIAFDTITSFTKFVGCRWYLKTSRKHRSMTVSEPPINTVFLLKRIKGAVFNRSNYSSHRRTLCVISLERNMGNRKVSPSKK